MKCVLWQTLKLLMLLAAMLKQRCSNKIPIKKNWIELFNGIRFSWNFISWQVHKLQQKQSRKTKSFFMSYKKVAKGTKKRESFEILSLQMGVLSFWQQMAPTDLLRLQAHKRWSKMRSQLNSNSTPSSIPIPVQEGINKPPRPSIPWWHWLFPGFTVAPGNGRVTPANCSGNSRKTGIQLCTADIPLGNDSHQLCLSHGFAHSPPAHPSSSGPGYSLAGARLGQWAPPGTSLHIPSSVTHPDSLHDLKVPPGLAGHKQANKSWLTSKNFPLPLAGLNPKGLLCFPSSCISS